MRVQGVTLPSWSRLVTTMLRVGWVFDSTYYTYILVVWVQGASDGPVEEVLEGSAFVVTFISVSYRETWKVSVVILAPKVT